MVPTLFARFFTNGAVLFQKAKEVALAQGYTVSADDPQSGLLHLHRKESGRTVHLIVHVGGDGDRALAVEVRPGDEGLYMDYGREYIGGLRKAVR